MAEENPKLKVAMFPWLAYGHMIPFLELAKHISQKGHTVFYISTPRNISRLPNLPSDLQHSVNFVSVQLPRVENRPENAEATIDIPVDQIPYLKIAYDGLLEAVSEFLEASAPDWIIYDVNTTPWLPPVAEKLGISRACFALFNAFTICFLGESASSMIDGQDPRKEPKDFTGRIPWVPFDADVAYRPFEARLVFEHAGPDPNISGVRDIARVGFAIAGCDVMAIRTCPEFETDWIRLLSQLHDKPVLPAGVLPPSVQPTADGQEDDSWREISGWLDKHEKKSVVYVALGSEAGVSRDEFRGLALGLERSGLPFFWAYRKPKGTGSVQLLPERFEEQVEGRGMVWTSWAPQKKILSHDSVGGFLTHCGWGSVVEGLTFGVPFIMIPLTMDEPMIARFLSKKKVGLEISRDEEDGSFTSDSVTDSLRLVVVEEQGEIYRENAKEMSKIFGDKVLQNGYVDGFLEFLQNHKASLKK